jgi:hypothetical protein
LFLEILEDAIGLRIAAPPVDGEANKELVRYVSRLVKLKTSEVSLDKVYKIRDFLKFFIYFSYFEYLNLKLKRVLKTETRLLFYQIVNQA